MSGPLVDLKAVLRGLADHEIDYVLFGSTAMLFYGFVRNTEDVDIVVRPAEENLRRIHDWLVSIDARLKLNPARTFGPRERWGMFKGKNATVLTSCGQIDVVQHIEGMPDFDDLVAEAELFAHEGRTIRVMNRKTWTAMKRRRASKQDLADIEAIEQLEQLDN